MKPDKLKDSHDKPGKEKTNKFKTITVGITIATVCLLALLTWLAATESGTYWLLRTALNEMEQVHIAEIQGTLVDELSLSQIHYEAPDEFSVSIADFNFKWQFSALLKGHLHIARLNVNGIDIKGQPAASEETESQSEIPKIPIDISIDKFAINQFSWVNGENKTEINQLDVSATLVQNNLTISRLELDMPEIQVSANSTVKIQSDWPISADLVWSYLQNETALNGHLTVSGDMKQFDLNSQIKGAVESSQKGFIRLSGDQPEFNLKGQWQKLQWPLAGNAKASSKRGDFHLTGTAEQYETRLNADIAAMDQPEFAMTLRGNGDKHSFDIKQLMLKPKQGQISLNGQFSWLQTIAFNLDLVADQLNPADFGTDIPGKLNLKAQSTGNIAGEDSKVALDIEQLTGELHGQPFTADGKVKLINQKLDIQQLNISAGNNLLAVKGWLSEQNSDLNLNIKAKDLSTAWPTMTGNLNGNTLIKGSFKKPVIKSNIQGNNIRFANNRVGEVYLLADYVHASDQQSRLDFVAKKIQLAETKVDRMSIQGLGNQKDHNAKLELISSLANLKINISGKWDGKRWFGQIKKFDIDHPQLQKWQLESETTLTLNKKNEDFIIDMPNSCLIQDNSRLCFNTKGSATQLDSQVSLSNWPLAATKSWLPDELYLTGLVSARAKISSGTSDTVADVLATISEGQALIKDESQRHKIPFSASTVKLLYQQDKLDCQLHLGLGGQDKLTATIKADRASSAGIRQISGTINAHIDDMTLLDGLVEEINNLKGHLIADLKLSGNSDKPVVVGVAQFENGQFEIAKLGSTFRNIQLKLNSTEKKPEHLLLNAEIESGKGKLIAKGELDLLAELNYQLQMKITGEKFQVSRLPEAEVVISPELTIDKLEDLTKIDGLIKIDSAKIEIKEVPENAISPSEDEVIITADKPKKKAVDTSRLRTRIGIQFGKNTHFSGFGLKTRLAGKLNYIAQEGKQSMQGQAEMRDATYRSYGQDLTIRKGEFVFSGPTDNPWLNIEAIRKATNEKITAILAVTGLLKSPETRIYTEPALPESEALAYLVTGKSMKGMSQSEGNAVANAAFSYGVGQLSWVSDQLGIDEFEFEQSDKIEDSAVRLGQYLNPDLYVGVSLGLFASKYAANIKYRLTDNISINTRAGETQRIEIKYHLEAE